MQLISAMPKTIVIKTFVSYFQLLENINFYHAYQLIYKLYT